VVPEGALAVHQGVPVCPDCGVIGATVIESRREFSVTSGTILASRKLSFRRLVLAIALSVRRR
jgi:hypothetical protein